MYFFCRHATGIAFPTHVLNLGGFGIEMMLRSLSVLSVTGTFLSFITFLQTCVPGSYPVLTIVNGV